MRKIAFIYLSVFALLLSIPSFGQTKMRGVPFTKNYTSKEYNAHNQNFDILADDYGTVFIANFEGLLYYDGATWRKVFTPGISRITRINKDQNGKIWVGGYNVFGYLVADANGCLQIKTILSDKENKGNLEVDEIKFSGSQVYMHTTQNQVFMVEADDKLVDKTKEAQNLFNSSDTGHMIYAQRTNNIKGQYEKWDITANGLACLEVNTPYSRVSENEGLVGEVYCLNEIGNIVYIGTRNGVYALEGDNLRKLSDIDLACWDLLKNKDGELLAPTSDGLYVISNKDIRRMTHSNTLSVCIDPETQDIITGEIDGIYRNSKDGKRVKISSIEKAIVLDYKGDKIIVTTIYRSSWQIPTHEGSSVKEKCVRKEADATSPKWQYKDRFGREWQTDNNGLNISLNTKTHDDHKIAEWTNPLKQFDLNTMYVCEDGDIIFGGDFGIIIVNDDFIRGHALDKKEKPYICEIVVMNDSVIWGGYTQGTFKPETDIMDIDLPVNCHTMTIYFSNANSTLISPTKYRYRVGGRMWSNWSTDKFVSFKNLQSGGETLEIQSKDAFGRVSDISKVSWYTPYPFYMRWWAILFYIVIIIGCIYAFSQWRTKRLEKEKQKLEGIVAERTSELQDTLDDLKRTQDDLVRMERTATAGKLTQGLIDRILNPINYINNFSKLTSGLAKDLHEDIEDEKDNMSEDNYDDCEDILDMMTQNLQKIEEHGVNTTRTLRAMEAMLNTHVGTLTAQDITPVCRQALKVAEEYHKESVAKRSIKVVSDFPAEPVMAKIDADSINRILISLLTNSFYAVAKKYDQCPYNCEITLKVEEAAENILLTVNDNGIGMEDTIKEKVFDPFFTTKPTGEAAGVGLYLVRELIHDHNADICVESEQGSYCKFIITFPKV